MSISIRIIKKWAAITVILLTIPLTAMFLTNEVDWGVFDFLVMGVLLFSFGMVLELIGRKTRRFKIIWIALVILTFLLIWAELGVGIFGTPFSGN